MSLGITAPAATVLYHGIGRKTWVNVSLNAPRDVIDLPSRDPIEDRLIDSLRCLRAEALYQREVQFLPPINLPLVHIGTP